jgi:hypothetical protein
MQLTGLAQVLLPHTPGMPPPPQVSDPVQLQSSAPPQPSPILPQYRPPLGIVQVRGAQLACTHTPEAVQLLVAPQAPQSSARPQPSPIVPQKPPRTVAAGQVSAGQLGPPTHSPFSQTWSAGQAPQSFVPLQPSPIVPQ